MPGARVSHLQFEFFNRHHLDVARELLGCTLHWDGVGGVIVETEAYAATRLTFDERRLSTLQEWHLSAFLFGCR